MNLYFFNTLYGLSHQSASVDTLLIFLATGFGNVVLILSLIFMLFHKEAGQSAVSSLQVFNKRFREICVYIGAIISSWVLVQILKIVFAAPRPFEALDIVPLILHGGGDSFPSGHAAIFGALATILIVFHRRLVTILLAVLALLVPLSRIAIGIHYPKDILAGLFVGILVALLFGLFLRKPKGFVK